MNILFLLVLLIAATSQAKNVTLTIPDQDISVVENDVMDAEIWIREAWAGKVNKCKERMIKAEVDRSIKAGEAVPAGDLAIIEKVLTNPNYKKRKDREK